MPTAFELPLTAAQADSITAATALAAFRIAAASLSDYEDCSFAMLTAQSFSSLRSCIAMSACNTQYSICSGVE